MDPLTISLAKLIGPAALAVGLGILLSKNYYAKAYRNLEKESVALFASGLLALVIGIAIVGNHNLWDNPLAGFVSLIGWLSIAKGLLVIIFPKIVDKIGDAIADSIWIKIAAVLYSIVGIYVTYIAFFA